MYKPTFSLAASTILMICSLATFAQSPKRITFVSTEEDFANPERGWMSSEEALNESFPQELWPNKPNSRISWIRWTLSDFRDGKDLTPKFYSEFQKMFDAARAKGFKIIPRVRYTDDRGPDAPLSTVLKHLGQLKSIFEKNSDVIYLIDPGMIGWWGEWHTSSNNLLTLESRNAIIDAALNATPSDRMMYIRYPVYKMDYIKSKGITNIILDSSRAFNGSPIARIGHMNDCLFSTEDDAGTYYPQASTTLMNREIGLNYMKHETPFLPHGGETCKEPDGVGLNKYNDCKEVLENFPMLHTNHLNSEFSEEVYWKWQRDGCYNLISRSLGYRFALSEATYSQTIKPGTLMDVSFKIKNSGFGQLINPRDVYVVLQNQSGKNEEAILSLDPRWWGGGSEIQVTLKLEIPVTLKEGTYKLALWLPDRYASIKNDPRYAIRLANENIWDNISGLNILSKDVLVSNSISGAVNNSYANFKQNSIQSTAPIFKKSPQGKINFQYSPRYRSIVLGNMSNTSRVKIQVFDVKGVLSQSIDKNIPDTQMHIEWNIPDLRPGTYWVKVSTQNQTTIHKIVQLQ